MPPRAKLRHSLTAPLGGWIRRRNRRETERRRAGKGRIEFNLREKIYFSDGDRKVRGAFVMGRRRRGIDWKGVATRALAKEQAEWVKRKGDEAAMENGSRAAHGDPRPARTITKEAIIVVFWRVFTRQ